MFGKRTRQATVAEDGDKVWAQAREVHEKGDEKKAFELYQRAATAGSVRALNSVGVCYMTGFGLKRKTDPVKAVSFFQQGSERGDPSAMLNLANALAKGDGLEKNEKIAFEWYVKAAQTGDEDSRFQMAVALFEGRGTSKDRVKARDIFAALVEGEKGYLKAYNYLAVCYAQGVGGSKKDQVKANEMFELAAGKGDPRAMYNLAMVHQHGLGVEIDADKSLQLHLKAWGDHGHLDSLVMLGVFYSRGVVVLVDDLRAFEIFTKAAQLNHVDALNHVGMACLNGVGTAKDHKKAFVHFKQAADLRDAVGLLNLANMCLNGSGTDKDERKACALLQEAIELGSTDAMVSLALCLTEGGSGVVMKDVPKAVELLTIACEKKNSKAMFARAQWLEQGVFVEKDVNLSLELYRKAMLDGHRPAGERYRALIMETLPESVKRGGKKQIDRFVQDIVDSGNMPWNQAKIMVLGKEGVGKTAMYHKIRDLPYPKNLSTEGIDVHAFKLNDMELIWFDFGGQTIFYPTHQFFLTARCIYLLCFKFGDDDSVVRVKYWLQDVQFLTRDPTRPLKLVVVGTYADAVPNEGDQQLVWESLKVAMDSLGHVVGHIAVSSQDGTGFEGLLRGIELAIDASKLRAVQVPKSYGMIETFIKETRKERPRMEWTEVRAAFPAFGEHHLQVAFDFFTDMGLCIYDQRLKIVVSDPQWLAKTFSVLVSFSQQWVKDGVVALQNLRHVWKGLSDGEIEQMMFLFEKFGVAFLKRKEGCWVIPTLLANDHSGSEFQWGPPRSGTGSTNVVLQERVFKLEFVPYGLFGRLIARLQSWCEASDGGRVVIAKAWQTGIVLEGANGQTAEITIDPNQNALVVRVVSVVANSVTIVANTVTKSPIPSPNPSPRPGVLRRGEGEQSLLSGPSSLPSKPLPKPPAKRDALSSGELGNTQQRSSEGSSRPAPRKPVFSEMSGSSRGSAPSVQSRSSNLAPVNVSGGPPRPVPRRPAFSDVGPHSADDSPPSSPSSSPPRSPRSPPGSWSRASKPAMDLKKMELGMRSSADSPASPPRSPRAGAVRLGSMASRASDAIAAANNKIGGGVQPSFMKQLVEQVVGLLDAVFEACSGFEIRAFVACPHCLNNAKLYVAPTYFAFSDCVDAVVNASSSLATLTCKGEPVSVELLDDDVTFRYVTVFREDEVVLEKQHFASGGFGNIFKGRFTADGRLVVAKELKPEKAKETFAELQHETSVMSSLRHPNLLQLYGVMLQPLRMMLEYCGEGDLYHALKKGRINTDELQYKLALDIANGLCFLHEQKPPLAHRDLRSPNVLLVSLDPKSAVCGKVCDFGLTMSVIERMRSPLPTWQWMAPEAQLGDYYTEACDLYSFGIVLFEIFDGKGEVPFSEYSSTMRMAEIFPLLRDGMLRPTLPEGLAPWMKSMIERLWSTVPSVRPSARQCVTSMTRRSVLPPVVVAGSMVMGMGSKAGDKHRPRRRLQFEEGRVFNDVACVSMSIGIKKVAVASANAGVTLIDLVSGELCIADQVLDASVVCVVSPQVWIGRQNGLLCCNNEETGEESFLFVENLDLSGSVMWMAALSQSRLIVADDKGWVCMIAVNEGSQPRVVNSSKLKQGVVCGCVINENSIWLAGKSSVFAVTIHDDWFDVVTVDRPGSGIRAMIFVGGAEVWAVGESELRIYVQGKPRFKFPVNASFCVAVVHCGGTRTVWIGQLDLVVVWDLKRRQVARFDVTGAGKVRCMAQGVTGDTVWIGTESDLREWRLEV